MASLLEIEAQLAGGVVDAPSASAQVPADQTSTLGDPADGHDEGGSSPFHKSKKSGTLKKYYKKYFKPGSTDKQPVAGAATTDAIAGMVDPSASHLSHASSCQDDPFPDFTSEVGRASRASHRPEGKEAEDGERKGTLKGLFSKRKPTKHIELDAIRLEMEMLSERCHAAEADLNSASHDASALRGERERLQQQVMELSGALSSSQSALEAAEGEAAKAKELHQQVKGALQLAYSQNQELAKQVKALEELCGQQQNSLEEAEERGRTLTSEQDELRASLVAAKTQLVSAQAQAADMRAARDELLAELSSLQQQSAALQSEIDQRDAKFAMLEGAQAEASMQMEVMLGRLREMEAERQQLEARAGLLAAENNQLAEQVGEGAIQRQQLQGQVAVLQEQLHGAQADRSLLLQRCNELMEERDAISAEVRASTEELGRLREQATKKHSSPLKWRFTGGGGSSSSGGGRQAPSSPASPRAAGAGSCTGEGLAGSALAPATSDAASVCGGSAVTAGGGRLGAGPATPGARGNTAASGTGGPAAGGEVVGPMTAARRPLPCRTHSGAGAAPEEEATAQVMVARPLKLSGTCTEATTPTSAEAALMPLSSASPELHKGALQGPLSMAAHGLGAGRRGAPAPLGGAGGGAGGARAAPPTAATPPRGGLGGVSVHSSSDKPFSFFNALFGGCMQPAVMEPGRGAVPVA